jgi:pyruvate/2-oxoglutarate dehydrogenase complex dihydrolipoamide dehydrogenase (E3) component
MTRRYDLVVIGTGTAAMVAAMRVRAAGWSAAVIDFRPFGGTCALRGCDPKKMRILGAHLVGPHADEVINVFALAIRKGLTAEDLKTTLFAYPTGASDISYMLQA